MPEPDFIPTLTDVLSTIIKLHRIRRLYHRQEKSLGLALGSQARYHANVRLGHIILDKGHNKVKKFHKAEPPDEEEANLDLPGLLEAKQLLKTHRKGIEKQLLERLALIKPALPRTCALVQETRGVADLTFVQLLAEAGLEKQLNGSLAGLERFRSVGAVWKRYGLGLVDGERQRRIRGDTQENILLGIKHGFNPERRAVVWSLGDNLVKLKDPHYRPIYERRRAVEEAKGITKPAIIHARSMRYIVKDFMRRFYKAYRADLGLPEPPGEYKQVAA